MDKRRRQRRQRQPQTELEEESSHQERRQDLRIITQPIRRCRTWNPLLREVNLSLSVMNQIRQNTAVRKEDPDPVNLNELWWERRWMETEDSDGLTKKRTLRNRESSGTKAHFTGAPSVSPLRDGLTQGPIERSERSWQDEWRTEEMTGTHTNTNLSTERPLVSRPERLDRRGGRRVQDERGLTTVHYSTDRCTV